MSVPFPRLERLSTALAAWLGNLSETRRGRKQVVGVLVDASLVALSLWAAYSLRHGEPFSGFGSTWHLFVLLPLGSVLMFTGLGVYRWVVRSTNGKLFGQLAKGALLSGLLLVLIAFVLPPERALPRSLFVIYAPLLALSTYGVRMIWRDLFDAGRQGVPIAVYGAGAAGKRLAAQFGSGRDFSIKLFIDDDPRLAGRTVAGVRVVLGDDPTLMEHLRKKEVAKVVLAMPSIDSAGYQRVLGRFHGSDVVIKTMPSIAELVNGEARPDEIRDVSIQDILGRLETVPDTGLMARNVSGKCVLVTGGGGSIGSELCRLIVGLFPTRLIVVDNCELNLYRITEELEARLTELGQPLADRFLPLLMSVTDEARIEHLFRRQRIDTVFHAAAYKHVPIVERQPEQGIDVNVIGTRRVLEAAIAAEVACFTLISTDKAVRPTNAMGATKRVAELILQAKAREPGSTRISMVRFGNVLGSSGSVVPKFKRQILSGGPITLTHPDVTRYLMTIPEAAQLVLQASAIARGGRRVRPPHGAAGADPGPREDHGSALRQAASGGDRRRRGHRDQDRGAATGGEDPRGAVRRGRVAGFRRGEDRDSPRAFASLGGARRTTRAAAGGVGGSDATRGAQGDAVRTDRRDVFRPPRRSARTPDRRRIRRQGRVVDGLNRLVVEEERRRHLYGEK